MRRSLGAIVPLAAALMLGACVSEQDTAASRLSAPTGALAAGNPNACDFNTMTKDGKAGFSNTDPILSIISDMQDAYNAKTGGGAAGATSKGFDVLAYIAQNRLTPAQHGTSAQLAVLVNDVLSSKCTLARSWTPQTTLDEFDASGALASALTNGIFAVRGGTQPLALAAVALVAGSARTEASPRWGIEPDTGCPLTTDPQGLCSWPSAPQGDGRYLLFGYPADANLDDEAPAATGAFNGKNGFVIGMISDIEDKTAFRVGACLLVLSGPTGTANLLLHDVPGDHSLEILPNKSPSFCATGYPAQASLTTKMWLASFTRRAFSVFTPTPLFAEDDDFSSKFSGGGPSGWSPITFTNLTASGITLSFGQMPKNGAAGGALVFTVHAATASHHGAGGVQLTVGIGNNSGIPGGATISPSGTGLTVQTDESGDAEFSVSVNKAGGYTFTVAGKLGAFPTQTAISALFNVKNH